MKILSESMEKLGEMFNKLAKWWNPEIVCPICKVKDWDYNENWDQYYCFTCRRKFY